ncbi:hypothetical protein [Natronocalculus amylovorans]|uniref:Copper resistance protein D domain-containing protein n=1 Tax=Natronocalculus amylovorans TaxID=2917812 RepID=A0AAE3K900_9EURY|nr:hypothetical protein [Natronocalculus amylovorans]MCL9817571.1 hypothetical protein [Natronocalculus amylovorans]NUE02402.1 hypothetical protein [Halorubraceae archaeon YAN]
MSFGQLVIEALHVVAVVVLLGATVAMAAIVVPTIRKDGLSAHAVRAIGRRFAAVVAVSGTTVLLTEVYLTSTQHTIASLVGTVSGWMVLASIGLWMLLVGLLGVGTGKLAQAVSVGETKAAADRSRRWYESAAVVGLVAVAMTGVL